jgi:D-alanyl-D-alanine dipeptidase
MSFLLACTLTACGTTARAPTVSDARTPGEAGLVDVSTIVGDLDLDIRYAGSHNFVGKVVDGYEAPRCYLLREPAKALRRVQDSLRAQHLKLRVFDCYRPVRAVEHFVRWAKDTEDQATKDEFYPNLPKTALLGDYIAPTSGHSRGATLDLTLLRCDATGTACEPLDMGTPFDFFDTLANTDDPRITEEQRQHRQLLRKAMEREGFENYPMEWWHYTFKPEPTPKTAYDVPVS